MNKENCALKLVDEIILYYDAQSKKHQNAYKLITKAWFIFIKNIENQMEQRWLENSRRYSLSSSVSLSLFLCSCTGRALQVII